MVDIPVDRRTRFRPEYRPTVRGLSVQEYVSRIVQPLYSILLILNFLDPADVLT